MTPTDFAKALLSRLHLPLSDNNIKALVAVQAIEGGHMANSAIFNPLNTMQSMPGSRDAGLKVKGIKAYSSWDEGLEATAKTIEQGTKTHVAPGFDMSDIYRSLARSAPPDETIRTWQLSHWGWDKAVKVAPVSAYLGNALKEFPGGGAFIDSSVHAIKELFTPSPRTLKIGAGVALGALAIGGAVLIVYFARSKRAPKAA